MLSALYGKIVDTRNALYDRGVFKSHDLSARTISVGNITTGGTGKTPLVAQIAEILAARGEKICILTRGYGRRDPNSRVVVSDAQSVLVDSVTGGDEPVELARKLLGKAIIIADPNRAAAGQWARERYGITTFILDDGFQHRSVKRDVDIVCIDAGNPFGNGKMLPVGRLREPVANLSRARVVVIMRAAKELDYNGIRQEIRFAAPGASVFDAERGIKEFRRVGEGPLPTGVEKFYAFAGLGNSSGFYTWLSDQAIDTVGFHGFRDHHRYTQSDIDALLTMARQKGATALLTTAKDAVKISDLDFDIPCFVLEIELKLDDPDGFALLL